MRAFLFRIAENIATDFIRKRIALNRACQCELIGGVRSRGISALPP